MPTHDELKEIVISAFEKESSRFEIAGKKFATSYYKSLGDISVWANNGARSLFTVRIPKEKTDITEYIDEITIRISQYLDGYIHCSDCGKLIKINEIAGGVFAGVYCSDCWENKWKAIDSNMNYD